MNIAKILRIAFFSITAVAFGDYFFMEFIFFFCLSLLLFTSALAHFRP